MTLESEDEFPLSLIVEVEDEFPESFTEPPLAIEELLPESLRLAFPPVATLLENESDFDVLVLVEVEFAVLVELPVGAGSTHDFVSVL